MFDPEFGDNDANVNPAPKQDEPIDIRSVTLLLSAFDNDMSRP